MPKKFQFKSFYFKLGNTSFRTENFNKKIELLIKLLDEFWKLDNNNQLQWNKNSQTMFYDFIRSKNFLKKGTADNKAKDAREITSGLCDLGLINDQRRITSAGLELIKIIEGKDFSINNKLYIPKDSYLYLIQLIKTSLVVNGYVVRPLIVLIKLINTFSFLTKEEFMYLYPLILDTNSLDFIVRNISILRDEQITIDQILIDIILEKTNYSDALKYFIESETLTDEVFGNISLNRKGSDKDKEYYKMLFTHLWAVYSEGNVSQIPNLFTSIKQHTNSKITTKWKKLIFGDDNINIKNCSKKLLRDNCFCTAINEEDFRKVFFIYMHLFKTKATLEDYFDLNRRYLNITDCFIFQDNKVEYDIIPGCYFKHLSSELYQDMFMSNEKLEIYTCLDELSSYLQISEIKLLEYLNHDYHLELSAIDDVPNYLNQERLKRFDSLIETKFSDEILIKLIDLFKNRNGPEDDSVIQSFVTKEADGPTIFEYITAIIWYKLSNKKGDILSYMNLSLQADLLPKTHAGGGEADIVWKYKDIDEIPNHTLLIEATLSDSTNQRRMEMEPVSRHLGEYCLKNNKNETYAVFISNYLNPNVIDDFRIRKYSIYRNRDESSFVKGLKIMPIDTTMLISLLQNKVTYEKLYKVFQEQYLDENHNEDWGKTLNHRLEALYCENYTPGE